MTFGAVGGAAGADEFIADNSMPSSVVTRLFMVRDHSTPPDPAAGSGPGGDCRCRRQPGDRAESSGGIPSVTRHLPVSPGFLEFDEAGDLKVVSITVFQVKDGVISPVKNTVLGE